MRWIFEKGFGMYSLGDDGAVCRQQTVHLLETGSVNVFVDKDRAVMVCYSVKPCLRGVEIRSIEHEEFRKVMNALDIILGGFK